MQLYAPIDEYPHAYHRVLYIFYCPNAKCARSGKEVKVFRSQAIKQTTLAIQPKPEKKDQPKPEKDQPEEVHKVEAPEKQEDKTKSEEKSEKKSEEKSEEKSEGKSEEKSEELKSVPSTTSTDASQKKKRRKKKKKSKSKVMMGVKALHRIDVQTEKADVTKHYVTHMKDILAGKVEVEEEEEVGVSLGSSTNEQYEKELLDQYMEQEKMQTAEEKLMLDVWCGNDKHVYSQR